MSMRRVDGHKIAHPDIMGVGEEAIADLEAIERLRQFRPAFVCGQVFREIYVSHCS